MNRSACLDSLSTSCSYVNLPAVYIYASVKHLRHIYQKDNFSAHLFCRKPPRNVQAAGCDRRRHVWANPPWWSSIEHRCYLVCRSNRIHPGYSQVFGILCFGEVKMSGANGENEMEGWDGQLTVVVLTFHSSDVGETVRVKICQPRNWRMYRAEYECYLSKIAILTNNGSLRSSGECYRMLEWKVLTGCNYQLRLKSKNSELF